MADELRLTVMGRLGLDGPEGEVLSRRRKELTLLFVLAYRAPRPVRREELTALFWGEKDEERARNSLRQSLLRIRRACDGVLEVSAEEVRVTEGRLRLDLRDFMDAAAHGRHVEAIGLWTGELLPGGDGAGGEEFGAWLEGERERLRRQLDFCYEQVVAGCDAASDGGGAVAWSGRWTAQFPMSERAHLGHIAALCRSARVSEAEAVRVAFVRRVREELGDEPDPSWLESTAALLSTARTEVERSHRPTAAPLYPGAIPGHGPSSADPQQDLSRAPPPGAGRAHRKHPPSPIASRAVRLATVGVLVLLALAWRTRVSAIDGLPVLAIGNITLLGVEESVTAVPQLIATRLARAPDLQVLSEARVRTVQARLSATDAPADLQTAARSAGADEMVEGVLSQRPGGGWRLDLQRVALVKGRAVASYRAEGSDLSDVVDEVLSSIARDLEVRMETEGSPASVVSAGAYRLYQEGLRAFYQDRLTEAARLFGAALDADPNFAMAAYYAGRAADFENARPLLARALQLSESASDRERLLIRAHWLAFEQEPAHLAVAETLAVRYPTELEAQQQYGRALVTAGRFLEAIPRFRRVIDSDAEGATGAIARCLACEAYFDLFEAYRLADSIPASVRVAEEWVDRQPGSPVAWAVMSSAYNSQGRWDEAMRAWQRSAGITQSDPRQRTAVPTDLLLRMGDFRRLDRFWSSELEVGDSIRQVNALLEAVTSLRTQGRREEALAAARRLRERFGYASGAPTHVLATVLFERGDFLASAALFDSIASEPFPGSRSRHARHRAWWLSHAATGYAAAGDTAALRRVENIVRIEGSLSAYRRDQLLHHYVQGLRLRGEGRHEAALLAFRRSLYSPVEGNARAVLELGRTMLALDRPEDAVPMLRSALAGAVGASNQYANRTELTLLLARACDRAGDRSCAVTNYRWVAAAWTDADPPVQIERTQVLARLRQLGDRGVATGPR